MGAMFRLPIVDNVCYDEILSFLKENNIAIFSTEIVNGVEFYNENYKKSLALIFGNEGNGISDELLSKVEKKIYIPMAGASESLNVGVAAGIIMYEVFRQRNSIAWYLQVNMIKYFLVMFRNLILNVMMIERVN